MQVGRSEAAGAHLNRPVDSSLILGVALVASGVSRSNNSPAASCPATFSCAGHASSFRLRRRIHDCVQSAFQILQPRAAGHQPQSQEAQVWVRLEAAVPAAAASQMLACAGRRSGSGQCGATVNTTTTALPHSTQTPLPDCTAPCISGTPDRRGVVQQDAQTELHRHTLIHADGQWNPAPDLIAPLGGAAAPHDLGQAALQGSKGVRRSYSVQLLRQAVEHESLWVCAQTYQHRNGIPTQSLSHLLQCVLRAAAGR